MVSRLRALLSPPVFADEDKTRLAKFLHVVLLTIMLIAILVGITDALAGVWVTLYGLLIGISPLVAAFWMLRRGWVTFASYLAVIAMIFAITILMAVGQGVHDIGMMDYALALIIASYLLRSRGVLFVTVLTILSVAVVVFGEIYHFLPVKVAPGYFLPRPADFVIVSLTLCLAAVAIGIISNDLNTALQKARGSEARWRSLVDHAPDIILNVDTDGKVLFVNHSDIDLPRFYIGKSVFDSLPPEYRSSAQQILAQVMTGKSILQEFPAYNVSGQLQWFSFRAGPTHGAEGAISGAIIVASNIQSRKDAEQEIEAGKNALQKRAEQLGMLYEIGKSITSLQTLDKLLETILMQMKTVLPLDAFFVCLYDEAAGMLSFPLLYEDGKLWHEPPSPISPNYKTDIVIRTGQSFMTNRADEEYDNWEALGNREKVVNSLMITPLFVGQRVIGAISAQSYQLDMYDQDMLALLNGAATQIAIAIENSRLYEELQKELAERKRVEVEIRELNASLEARVRARTAELETTSKELGAFTYTVSHDLRAPLRGVSGFSHILLQDYSQDLPQPAREHLLRIQENAIYMGRLIDDLLTFTRLGRHPIRKVQVELTLLAQQAFNEVTRHENLARIEFHLQPLPAVQADPMLLKQVLVNLLANAIKFSSAREIARIEVGSQQVDGETAFYIKDNGAGFDMAYRSKLFGMFQRLHHQSEFEGTGVGLAIVQRILQRHGGRIWAESTLGQGATFYFTLNPQEQNQA